MVFSVFWLRMMMVGICWVLFIVGFFLLFVVGDDD